MRKTSTSKHIWLFILVSIIWSQISLAQTLLNPKTQPQFVNPLPIPSVVDGRNGGTFTIGISQFDQWLGLIDPVTQQHMNTKVWGYNGTYPGPTILTRKEVARNVSGRSKLGNGSNQP